MTNSAAAVKSIVTLLWFADQAMSQLTAADNFTLGSLTTAIMDDAWEMPVRGAYLRALITWSEPHPELANRELGEIARDWGCTERAAAERLLPAGAVYFQLDEADVQCILADPHTMIGSDGLPHDHHPHPRLWGTFPRVLGHYARGLGLFGLEEAVFRMTGLPAREFGLAGRGRIAVGFKQFVDPAEAKSAAAKAAA